LDRESVAISVIRGKRSIRDNPYVIRVIRG